MKLLCGLLVYVLKKLISVLCREREFTSSQRSTELMSMVTGILQNGFAARFVFFPSLDCRGRRSLAARIDAWFFSCDVMAKIVRCV